MDDMAESLRGAAAENTQKEEALREAERRIAKEKEEKEREELEWSAERI